MSQNPHHSSVLGAVAYALGLEPQQGLETALRLGNASGISRILDGARATPVSMLRELEPAVDMLTRPAHTYPTYSLPVGVAHLVLARTWLTSGVLLDRLEDWQDQPESGRFERMGPLANAMGIASMPDVPSLFAGACRAVCWSASDVVEELNVSRTMARSMIAGETPPSTRDWERLAFQFERLSRYGHTPSGAAHVACHWIDRPRERAQLEWEYSRGDAPLFCE